MLSYGVLVFLLGMVLLVMNMATSGSASVAAVFCLFLGLILGSAGYFRRAVAVRQGR